MAYARFSTMRRTDGKIHAAFAPSFDGARIQVFESSLDEGAVRTASVVGRCDATGDLIARLEPNHPDCP